MKVEFTDEERKMLKELIECNNFMKAYYGLDVQDIQDKELTKEELREHYIKKLDAMFLEDEVIHKVTFQGNLKEMLNDMAKKLHSWKVVSDILEEYLHFSYEDVLDIDYNKELDTTTIQYFEF